MANQGKPTVRDLAGSAVDLHGYAVLFQQIARTADKDGVVRMSASRLVHISEFMGKVVDELLALLPPEKVEDVSGQVVKHPESHDGSVDDEVDVLT